MQQEFHKEYRFCSVLIMPIYGSNECRIVLGNNQGLFLTSTSTRYVCTGAYFIAFPNIVFNDRYFMTLRQAYPQIQYLKQRSEQLVKA